MKEVLIQKWLYLCVCALQGSEGLAVEQELHFSRVFLHICSRSCHIICYKLKNHEMYDVHLPSQCMMYIYHHRV